MKGNLPLQPWHLDIDNFTPPTRTPWGGRVIIDHLKRDLPIDPEKAEYRVVGESWEVSVEPSFPSRVLSAPGAPLLSELIARDPVAALGPAVAERFGGLPLLVKLLDSAHPLSVQVHPRDDYSALLPHQCGKPESWVVVGVGEGAGLYLGLGEGVSKADVVEALGAGADLAGLLNHVPVAVGDCFQIDAGTIHAISGGVTLVEPQQVIPAKEGITYRFWDWNRRYDDRGRYSEQGRPRPLHVEHSLAVANFEGLRGKAFVESVRRRPRLVREVNGARYESFINAGAFAVGQLRGRGRLKMEIDGMLAVVMVSGAASCETRDGRAAFGMGESFVVPAAAGEAVFELDDCWAVVSRPLAEPG